jgi:nucleoside-diphosphate-sugar epimerase
MRIAVTGAYGFSGKYIARRLLELLIFRTFGNFSLRAQFGLTDRPHTKPPKPLGSLRHPTTREIDARVSSARATK